MALQRLAVKTAAESYVGPVVDDEGDVLAAAGLQAGGDAGGGEAGGVGDAHWSLLGLRGLARDDGDGGGDGVP